MPTIPRLLSEAAVRWKGKAALVGQGETTSFAELDARATDVARAFLVAGLQKGDRVALWAPNMWEWGRDRGRRAADRWRAGTAQHAATRAARSPMWCGARTRASCSWSAISSVAIIPTCCATRPCPGCARQSCCMARAPARRASKASSALSSEADDALFAERTANVTEDDIADIMFTSGTTGVPKGAVFDHRRSIGGGRAWQYISRLNADDRYCCFGPFSHNASYKAGWIAGLLTGASIYWPEAYDAATILSLIADNRITVMPAPPTVWLEAHGHPHRADWDTSSLRYLSTGATTVPIELMKRLKRDMNIPVISTGYGMTECAGSATHTKDDDDIERLFNTVGCPLPGTEIKIVGADGHALPVGEAGEVLIRDDKLLIEYLDNPEATRAAIDSDGWLRSGDVGAMTTDGYLRITDRMKDMYIVGGFNVYPAEIERQMSQLPGLHYCSIVGIPDQRLGEVGHAFVVRAAGSSLTEREVIGWSKQNLANYKVPRGVTFVDELPMNASGKVLKFKLKELV